MKQIIIVITTFFVGASVQAQLKWINVDSAFQPLPENFHVYKTTDSLDGKPFIAYYAEATLKDKHLDFTVDTSKGRRLTPTKFYEKNAQPLLVVNTTFFSYQTNKSINVVIKDGDIVFYNTHTIPMKGKDTFQYRHTFPSAIGFTKQRSADIAWVFTDSLKKFTYAAQIPVTVIKDSVASISFDLVKSYKYSYHSPFNWKFKKKNYHPYFFKWKMKTAVGGGPVLVQNNQIKITNEEELRFNGKAINDKHPRTCMGYTSDGRLIIMVIQGRFPGLAEGATLPQQAKLLVELGCKEALNLDGGGSSCMLINGKETIKPCDKEGQRPVPAVFIIR